MKKLLFFAAIFCLPLLSEAQWVINLNGSAGMAKRWSSKSGDLQSFYSTPGVSFTVGGEVQYYFTKRTGLGFGVEYAYSRALNDDYNDRFHEKTYYYSKTIRLPISFLWLPGNLMRSVIRIGISGNINTKHHNYDLNETTTYRDNPFFMGIHAGYSYLLGKRFRLGILLNEDMGWFVRESDKDNISNPPLYYTSHYFFTANVSFSYRIFGKEK